MLDADGNCNALASLTGSPQHVDDELPIDAAKMSINDRVCFLSPVHGKRVSRADVNVFALTLVPHLAGDCELDGSQSIWNRKLVRCFAVLEQREIFDR